MSDAERHAERRAERPAEQHGQRPGETRRRSPIAEARPTSHARPPVKGRWAVSVSIAAVVVVVGVIALAVPRPGAAPPPGGTDGVGLAPAGARSSSAFCTAGAGTAAASTIYLTNTTSHPVAASMTTVAAFTGGRPASVLPRGDRPTSRDGRGQPRARDAGGFDGLDHRLRRRWGERGPSGRRSGRLVDGSVRVADLLQLGVRRRLDRGRRQPHAPLFNPSASPATVNVSFLTPHGVMTPQPYQGLLVAPGQLVVENVGDYVQNVPAIATIVSADSGALVSDELQQTGSPGLSLRLGSPISRPRGSSRRTPH